MASVVWIARSLLSRLLHVFPRHAILKCPLSCLAGRGWYEDEIAEMVLLHKDALRFRYVGQWIGLR